MSGIKIYAQPDGVFARVTSYPARDEGPTVERIAVELERLGFDQIDEELIAGSLQHLSNGNALVCSEVPDELPGTCWVELDERNGAKITVASPCGDGDPVMEPDVIAELEKAGAGNYEIVVDNIAKTLQECLKSTKPVTFSVAKLRETSISCDIDSHKLFATLTIRPGENGITTTLDEVRNLLKRNGVVFGVDEDRIRELLGQNDRVEDEIIAKADPPEEGVDARIEYLFDAFHENVGPAILEDDRADFKDLGLFENAKEGDTLAQKIERVPGTAGTNVCHESIPPRPVQDVSIRAGKNTQLVDGGQKLISQIQGQPKLVQGKVSVEEVLIVRGDVDFSTGNIDFIGSVIVNGSILTGFEVKAKGDIHCMDVVEGGIIEAEGDIVLKWGIKGQGKGRIKAGGDIKARFVESCYIEAKGSIEVEDVIIHSEVRAGKNIVCTSGYGWIDGGTMIAGENILCNVLGSPSGVSTEVEVGVKAALREEYLLLESEVDELKKQIEKHGAIINKMNVQRKRGGFRADMIVKYKAAMTNYDTVKAQCDALLPRYEELAELVKPSLEGSVTAAHTSHPFVSVTIGNVTLECKDAFRTVRFYYDDGKIAIEDAKP